MDFLAEDILKVLAALVAGACLGIEREYHDKPAGFRTLTLICIGSTVFTIISASYFETDRVASNIATGIGFLGAGVMLKEGLSIKGITTAATIWVTAALGMAIGVGAYMLAAMVLVLVLVTLIMLDKLEKKFNNVIQNRTYEITFKEAHFFLDELEKELDLMKVRYTKNQLKKTNNRIIVTYTITAGKKTHNRLTVFLAGNNHVETFEG